MPKQRLVPETRVYVVGEDLTTEEYNAIILGLADWYAKTRDTREPAALARQEFDFCLRGVNKQGIPWKTMESAPLRSRVLSMCRFDIDTKQGRENATDKQKRKKQREKERLKQRAQAAQQDPLIPDELRKEQRRTARYGDNPNVFLSSEEEREWRRYREGILKEHPELNTVTMSALLDQLCDRIVLQKRQRMKVLGGERVDPQDSLGTATEIEKLTKMLGISADQLAKKVTSKQDTSVAAAAARLDSMGDWRKIRLRWFAEEMLQAYASFMRPTADGLGYQLDEVGLFGLTRCRAVECPKCNTLNYAGFTIDEIEGWLVAQGYLKPAGEGEVQFRPASRVLDVQEEPAEEESDGTH